MARAKRACSFARTSLVGQDLSARILRPITGEKRSGDGARFSAHCRVAVGLLGPGMPTAAPIRRLASGHDKSFCQLRTQGDAPRTDLSAAHGPVKLTPSLRGDRLSRAARAPGPRCQPRSGAQGVTLHGRGDLRAPGQCTIIEAEVGVGPDASSARTMRPSPALPERACGGVRSHQLWRQVVVRRA